MQWFNKVTNDLGQLPACINYYDAELEEAKKDVRIGGKVEKNLADLPGITEQRFNQLQEIEAILKHLEISLRKIRTTHFQKYLEKYDRALSAREADKYVEGEDEVINMETLINEVALTRNKWLGILKGLEAKSFNLGHLTRLRTAGMEDYTI
jgi:16S rRNA C967 or C1407 C5-methylase (RsmB/RsmF family)